MLKGYTFRLHPTPAQAEFLIKTIGCARFIYNKLLEDRIAIREEAKAGEERHETETGDTRLL